LAVSRTRTRATSMGAPTLRTTYSAFSCKRRTTPPPTVPQPRRATRIDLISRSLHGQSFSCSTPLIRSWRRGLDGLFLDLGLGNLLERRLEHLIHLAHEQELELVFDLCRHLV